MQRCLGVVLAFVAVVPAAGADAPAKDLSGNWKFFVGPRPADGRLATLALKQEGEKLTGKVVLPGGMSQEIHEGKVSGKTLSFVIQIGANGANVHHSGEVSGDTIKGATEFEPPGGPRRPHFPWEAQRATD